MIIIHYPKIPQDIINDAVGYTNETYEMREFVRRVKEQVGKRSLYTGNIRLWIEIPITQEISFKIIEAMKRFLTGLLYKNPKQITEILIRKLPKLKGMNILIQNLSKKKFSYAGYDKLNDYILIPDIETIKIISQMNEAERKLWRKVRKKESVNSQLNKSLQSRISGVLKKKMDYYNEFLANKDINEN